MDYDCGYKEFKPSRYKTPHWKVVDSQSKALTDFYRTKNLFLVGGLTIGGLQSLPDRKCTI